MKDNILRDNPSQNVISVYKQGVVLKQTSDNAIPEVMLGAYCKVDKRNIPSKILDYFGISGYSNINNFVFKNKYNYYIITLVIISQANFYIIGENIDVVNVPVYGMRMISLISHL